MGDFERQIRHAQHQAIIRAHAAICEGRAEDAADELREAFPDLALDTFAHARTIARISQDRSAT